MIHEGFRPDFPPQVMTEALSLKPPGTVVNGDIKDLRHLFWSSIDNSESRDLDQVEWVEKQSDGSIRVLVGIADVEVAIKPQTATDLHAQHNAVSVYTGVRTFPMLPERFSTDLTSLNENAERIAVVIEFLVCPNGEVCWQDVYSARIHNRARLSYSRVGAWLQGDAATPTDKEFPAELERQLRMQREASLLLMKFRKEQGALTLGSVERVLITEGNRVKSFTLLQPNPARDLIESFMVAANVAMARFLRQKGTLAIRRVVRQPKRWDRIQCLAREVGVTLPDEPDSRALSEFLAKRRQEDPTHFPELSLGILKSLGPGEYVVEPAGAEHEGHFGLAVNDYTHSTAPNRRYADLLTQRLLKATLQNTPSPYPEKELAALAAHCTERDSAARHVERFMKKVAAALLLQPRIGEEFRGIVTGVAAKGTFVRLLDMPAEGRVIRGEQGLDVGDKVRVRLVSVEVDKGFIDLQRVQ